MSASQRNKNNVRNACYRLLDLLGANKKFRKMNRHAINVFSLHGVVDFSKSTDWVPLRDQMSDQRFKEMCALARPDILQPISCMFIARSRRKYHPIVCISLKLHLFKNIVCSSQRKCCLSSV